jgi:hypothetical protein
VAWRIATWHVILLKTQEPLLYGMHFFYLLRSLLVTWVLISSGLLAHVAHTSRTMRGERCVHADLKDLNGSKGKAGAASLKKCCQEALLVMLKSEDPVLMQQEQRIYRGLTSLQAEQQASEAIKRRNMYESIDTDRPPLGDLNC